jgi:hypothetical protein
VSVQAASGRKVARRPATEIRMQTNIGATHLAFVDRPVVLGKFTSLIPSRSSRSRKTATAPETPTTSSAVPA